MKTTSLKLVKDMLWQEKGIVCELEFQFAKPRKWRFDLAIPSMKIALECDGGLWTGGGHNRGKHIIATHDKLNSAAIAGWRILYCTPQDVRSLKAVTLLNLAVMEWENEEVK